MVQRGSTGVLARRARHLGALLGMVATVAGCTAGAGQGAGTKAAKATGGVMRHEDGFDRGIQSVDAALGRIRSVRVWEVPEHGGSASDVEVAVGLSGYGSGQEARAVVRTPRGVKVRVTLQEQSTKRALASSADLPVAPVAPIASTKAYDYWELDPWTPGCAEWGDVYVTGDSGTWYGDSRFQPCSTNIAAGARLPGYVDLWRKPVGSHAKSYDGVSRSRPAVPSGKAAQPGKGKAATGKDADKGKDKGAKGKDKGTKDKGTKDKAGKAAVGKRPVSGSSPRAIGSTATATTRPPTRTTRSVERASLVP